MSLKSVMKRLKYRSPERQREYERNLNMIEGLSGVPQRPRRRYYEEEEEKIR